MALAGRSGSDRDLIALTATWIIAIACLLMLATLVVSRRGNLAWDDADYLRRGLADARQVMERPALQRLPRMASLLIQEQPKPPFLVGWLMLGASVIGRAHLDALMLEGSVLPFALLIVATVVVARQVQGGIGTGLAALVLLLSSPRVVSFGGKVRVETFLGLWITLAIALAAKLASHPSRKAGTLLGLMTGLALLTKLTAVLLLAGAVGVLVGWVARRNPKMSVR